MTLEQIEAEIATLQRQQENQRKHWLRWGYAFLAGSLVLSAVIFLKVALTGDDPSAAMGFIVFTLLFVGISFTTAGRPDMPRLQ
jgi:hypothetical protein